MSNPEDGMPAEADKFKFPEIPGLADPKVEAVQPKYYEGQPYHDSWWGRPDEFNEALRLAKSKIDEDGNPKELWLNDENCLTEAGVKELERTGKEKSSSQIDRLAASKAGHDNRIVERPAFPSSHRAARNPVEQPVKSSVDRLEAARRKIAAMGEKEKSEPITEVEVLDLFEQALKAKSFKVLESNVVITGKSPLGKNLYILEVRISRDNRNGNNKPWNESIEGSRENILERIGKLK